MWVKWLGREADHSHSSNARVKLSEIIHSVPHACIQKQKITDVKELKA
jgi:hypothetical protein